MQVHHSARTTGTPARWAPRIPRGNRVMFGFAEISLPRSREGVGAGTRMETVWGLVIISGDHGGSGGRGGNGGGGRWRRSERNTWHTLGRASVARMVALVTVAV